MCDDDEKKQLKFHQGHKLTGPPFVNYIHFEIMHEKRDVESTHKNHMPYVST